MSVVKESDVELLLSKINALEKDVLDERKRNKHLEEEIDKLSRNQDDAEEEEGLSVLKLKVSSSNILCILSLC